MIGVVNVRIISFLVAISEEFKSLWFIYENLDLRSHILFHEDKGNKSSIFEICINFHIIILKNLNIVINELNCEIFLEASIT